MAETLAGIRLVVVEDHSDSRDIFGEALRFMGASVITAKSAEEALRAISDADLVVTDFELPERDGAWLLEQINASAHRIPVVLVSGFAACQRPAVDQAPFALKLLKPVDPWDLAAEILKLLKQ